MGCEAVYPLKYIYFCDTKIQDLPESPILHVIEQAVVFISEQISKGYSVLVHCVYGQSRSATICAGYLISIGMSFNNALDYLKLRHPSICINPGFLTQLYLFCYKSMYLIQYHLTLSCTQDTLSESNLLSLDETIKCKDCLYPLIGQNSCINLSAEEEILRASVKPYIDPFWENYYSLYSSQSRSEFLPSNLLVIQPTNWMVEQSQRLGPNATRRKGTKRKMEALPLHNLLCRNCRGIIGKYRLKDDGGILITGGYLLSHLFCLDKNCVSMPCEEKVKCETENLDNLQILEKE